jgi:hypothetical protein
MTAGESHQILRAHVWLGMAQLGAGLCKDAEATFRAARAELRLQRPGVDLVSDRLDLQLQEWIDRSRGN